MASLFKASFAKVSTMFHIYFAPYSFSLLDLVAITTCVQTVLNHKKRHVNMFGTLCELKVAMRFDQIPSTRNTAVDVVVSRM